MVVGTGQLANFSSRGFLRSDAVWSTAPWSSETQVLYRPKHYTASRRHDVTTSQHRRPRFETSPPWKPQNSFTN